jgi:hypothetical protein
MPPLPGGEGWGEGKGGVGGSVASNLALGLLEHSRLGRAWNLGIGSASFPLTPALSPGERENRSPRRARSQTPGCVERRDESPRQNVQTPVLGRWPRLVWSAPLAPRRRTLCGSPRIEDETADEDENDSTQGRLKKSAPRFFRLAGLRCGGRRVTLPSRSSKQ